MINDAAASLTALAAAHKRNTTWPALAVRKASNLTADEALKMNVIDFVSPSLPKLLETLDGYKTKDPQRPFTLHLAGAHIDYAKPGFFTRLLNTIIDPNIIGLLFLAGLAGVGFEVLHPGVVLPGALGGVALLTALFGFSVLPISWAGLALILLGVALLVIDAHVVTHGALTVAGLIEPGRRDADALPQRPGAVPHVPAAGSHRSPLRSAASGRSRSGRRCRSDAARSRSGRTGSSAPRASSAARGRSSSGASSGGRIARTGASSYPASTFRWSRWTASNSRCGKVPVMTAGLVALVVVLFLVGLFLFSAIKVAREYERGIIFRLGRLLPEPKGPGLFILIPIVDRMVKVDLRTITLNIPPQEVITKDNVPVRVNAVAYFRIVEPKDAIVQVENFMVATSQIAQTTLRAVLGQHMLDELLSEREKINSILQEIIDESTAPWGIKVSIVEVKDVEIPAGMQRAMARQAEAERERRAKIINAEGEYQAAERLKDAAIVIEEHPIALQLRYLQTLLELGAGNTSTIIFPAPIDLIKPFLDRAASSG